jgi:hypothetical protein
MAKIPRGGFKNAPQLEKWLNGLPKDVGRKAAVGIALRAALRASVFLGWRSSGKTVHDKSLTIATFWANAISRVALKYPTRELARAADAAAADAAFAAADAAFAAADAAAAARAADAAARAADAAARAADAAAADAAFAAADAAAAARAADAAAAARAADAAADAAAVWAAITTDARMIARTQNPADLLGLPLWPDGAPQVWTDAKSDFASALTQSDAETGDGWIVWKDWYDSVAAGKNSFYLPIEIAEKLDRKIALGDGRKDFWDREPGVINREIAGWVEEAKREALQRSSNKDDENGALTQRVAPHHYEDKDGRIFARSLKSTAASNDFSSAIWAETKEKIDATRTRLKRTQTPSHIIDTLDRLYECMAGSLAEMNPGVLLMRGKTLEAILAAYSLEGMSAELPGDALTLISDLADSLGDLKALFPEIIKLESERIAQKIASSQAAAFFEKTQEIAAIANKAPDIVDQSVNDAFEAAFAEILESQRVAAETKDPDARAAAIEKEAHQIAFASLDTRNFAARLIKSAKHAVKKAGADVGGRVYKGTLDGIEEGTKATTKAGIVILVAKVAGPLAALAALVAMFNPLAKEAKEIGEKDTKEHTTEV